MKKLLLFLSFTSPFTLFGLECNETRMAKEFCQDLINAEDCLDNQSSCGRYTAEAMVKSILLLGKIDVAARHFYRSGKLDGEVGDRFVRFSSRLHDQNWWVSSHDANWLAAAKQIIDITKSHADKFGRLTDQL